MSAINHLKIPPAATDDSKSFEILRVWIANEAQHVSLLTDVWKDAAAWGIMLADLARHVAESYYQKDGRDVAVTLARIKAGMDAELE